MRSYHTPSRNRLQPIFAFIDVITLCFSSYDIMICKERVKERKKKKPPLDFCLHGSRNICSLLFIILHNKMVGSHWLVTLFLHIISFSVYNGRKKRQDVFIKIYFFLSVQLPTVSYGTHGDKRRKHEKN
jgi:hypothetical protein